MLLKKVQTRLPSMLILIFIAMCVKTQAQEKKEKDENAFVAQSPAIGDTLPDLTVYDPNGREVTTASLGGQYVVLTFGCLT